jgi:hypothetical protein
MACMADEATLAGHGLMRYRKVHTDVIVTIVAQGVAAQGE